MKGYLDRGMRVAILGTVAVLLVLLTAVIVDTLSSQAGHPTQAGFSPSASPEMMQMGLAHIPTSNACVLCHESGGSVGIKVVPAIAHPLEGWRACLTCHTNPKLGRTAPGHDGIPESECLNCHKVAQPGPAITQPHAALADQHCLDCHGKVSHLPSSMASKDEDSCTLCHKPTSEPPPAVPHPEVSGMTCRTCHQSGQVGALPIDHALRSDVACVLCHDVGKGPSPATPRPAESGAPGTPRPTESGLPGT